MSLLQANAQVFEVICVLSSKILMCDTDRMNSQESSAMESVDSLIHAAFRSEQILAEFAPIPALMNEVSPHFRLAMVLEMLEHPPFPLMRQQIANLNIVCSIQKVGSTTICETLSRHPSIHCRSNLRHVHFLSQNNLAFLNEQLSRCRNHPNSHEWVQHMAHCHWVRTLLAANKAIRRGGMASSVDKPVVITGVREPIAQYLSMVFQNWWMYVDSPAALTTEFLQRECRKIPGLVGVQSGSPATSVRCSAWMSTLDHSQQSEAGTSTRTTTLAFFSFVRKT